MASPGPALVQTQYLPPYGANNRSLSTLHAVGTEPHGNYRPSSDHGRRTNQYALPVRSGSVRDHAAPHSLQPPASNEHQLRRKTPSGTIDAAYDAAGSGTSIHAAKHLIVSTPQSSFRARDPAFQAFQNSGFDPPVNTSSQFQQQQPDHIQHLPQPSYVATNQPLPNLQTAAHQPYQNYPYNLIQHASINPSDQFYQPGPNDQYIPMAAHPPMYPPLPSQYTPAISNPTIYGFHAPSSYRGAGTMISHPPGFPMSHQAHNGHNIGATDLYFQRGPTDHMTLPGLQKRSDNGHDLSTFNLGQGGLQTFAERAAKIPYLNPAITNPAAAKTDHRPVRDISRPSTNPNNFAQGMNRFQPSLQEVQRILYHSYTCYASLVAAIQEMKKGTNGSSSRQQSQPLQMYPEATRKQYYRQDSSVEHSYSHQNNGSRWRNRQVKRNSSGFQADSLSSLEILPQWIIDAHEANTLASRDRDPQRDGTGLSTGFEASQKSSGPQNGWYPHLPPSADTVNIVSNARNALQSLTELVYNAKSSWLDGMQMAGSLAFVLGDFSSSYRWFRQMLDKDPAHVEAIANLGVVMIARERRQEAEYYWRLALKIQPDYFDAAEQLVTLLCHEQRHQDAIQVVKYIQRALVVSSGDPSTLGLSDFETSQQYSNHTKYTNGVRRSEVDAQASEKHMGALPYIQPQYAVQDTEMGRMMALIHAKGNILYSLHDQNAAAQAFEEVVLLATGIRLGGLRALISLIQTNLAEENVRSTRPSREPLLLSPEKALATAKLCFGPDGDLPGLRRISNAAYRKSAVSCISNSLLSLAKIFQDGISSLSETPQRVYRAGISGILVLYYLSLSLQPSPSTANNVGILLANVQQSSPPRNSATSTQKENFMFPGVVAGSGVALALTYYQYGLSLDSKHAHLFTNLGSLLKDIGQLSLAIKMYEKAVACDGKFDIALANLANAVKDQGKTAEAISYYKRAVQVNPDFAEAVCGLANALNSICNWAGRGGVVIHNGMFDRWHVDAAGGLKDMKAMASATPGWIQRVYEIVESQLVAGESWGQGLLRTDYLNLVMEHIFSVGLLPKGSEARGWHPMRHLLKSWHSDKWEGARIVRLIERTTKLTQWKWYREKWIQGREVPISTYARPQLPGSLSTPTAPTVLPFHTFTFPMTAKQVRLISQRNALRVSCMMLRSAWLPKTVFPPPAPPNPHLRVGYVSSDFNNHPLAHLMQSVFGMHNSKYIKAFCYATTASDKSIYRQKIESEAPVFYDVSGWSLEQLVQQIVQDGIHILVNLNGYTRGARNEVFAARPAPIQMSFMGFAGSLGAEWCDYLLADEMAIPSKTLRPWRRNVGLEDLANDQNNGGDNLDWVYSENIIYTHDTFFCCDHRQSSSSEDLRKMTWAEEQGRRWAMRKQLFPDLNDDAIIFGNFNQLYKIDPTTFRTWLRILGRVPNSILWLLRFPEAGEQHLRETAVAWAGPSIAARIVFTDVAPKAVHIARACVADLFLDTPECNAHTTAADCLWSGTPILTLPRYDWKMCSRMAAGILGGALPRHRREGKEAWEELVVGSEEEYEATAIRLGCDLRYPRGKAEELGKGRGRLMDLRKMLWHYRWQSKLFDTQRWVSDLELAYQEAWRRWVAGEGGDIWLKDLI